MRITINGCIKAAWLPRLALVLAVVACCCLNAAAKARLTPHYNVADNTYNFWL